MTTKYPLTQMMQERGISQDKLAAYLNISTRTLRGWAVNPTDDQYRIIEEALQNIDPDYNYMKMTRC